MTRAKSQVLVNNERVDADSLNFKPAPPSPEFWAEEARKAEAQKKIAEAWPRTVDEAVARLLTTLDEASKARLRAMPRGGLGDCHFSWGLGIRNAFGLRGGNEALKRSCGRNDPDDCSSVIMNAVWEALRSNRSGT